jgi:hypothetical protein
MSTKVLCGKCGFELTERPDIKSVQRLPCPTCGSTVRNFVVTVDAVVSISTGVVTIPSSTLKQIQKRTSPFEFAFVKSIIDNLKNIEIDGFSIGLTGISINFKIKKNNNI